MDSVSVKLIHGDCLERMSDIPDKSIDLTVTSPPYDNLRTYNGSLEWGEHVWKPVIKELLRVTKEGGVVVWIVGDATINGSETGTSFRQALWAMECGFNLHDTMIYQKLCYMPLTHNRYENVFEYMFVFSKFKPKTFNPILKPNIESGKVILSNHRHDGNNLKSAHRTGCAIKEYGFKINVWPYKTGWNHSYTDRMAKGHPAVFPEKLAQDHIISWSNEGDTVLDCFMGSGTTGIASVLTNRNFIGIEKEESYFKIAEKRIYKAVTSWKQIGLIN